MVADKTNKSKIAAPAQISFGAENHWLPWFIIKVTRST